MWTNGREDQEKEENLRSNRDEEEEERRGGKHKQNTTVRYQHPKPATIKAISLPFPLFSPTHNDPGDPCQVQGPGSAHGALQGHHGGMKLHRDASCQRIS